MEIRKGTMVICDYLLPQCALAVIQKVFPQKEAFLVKVVWPDAVHPRIIRLKKKALTPMCDQPDDLRKIIEFLKKNNETL